MSDTTPSDVVPTGVNDSWNPVGTTAVDQPTITIEDGIDIPPPTRKGGVRAGAGRPPGPHKRTRKRLAYLQGLVKDVVAAEAFAELTPMDIITIASWRMMECGDWVAAADLQARLLPYKHSKQPTFALVAPMDTAELQRRAAMFDIANDPDPEVVDVGKREG